MSSNSQLPPLFSVSNGVAKVERDIAWIRGHILVAAGAILVIAGSIIGGMSLFEGLIEKHDARVAAQQQQRLGVDTATQAAFLAQLTQMQTANAARDAEQTALIKTLASQLAQMKAETAKQVAADATLDARDAADRLIGQTKVSPSEVTVINDNVTMDLPLTRIVVADLDQLPAAQAEVTNLQGQLTAQQILTADAQGERDKSQQVIAADKVELVSTVKADNAACNLRVQQEVDKAKKRGRILAVFTGVFGAILRSLL